MASVLTHMPSVLASYLWGGGEAVSGVAEDLLWAASRQPDGKFAKGRVAYLPVSPFPPVLWRPKCGRCRFWVGGEPGTPGRCRLVGRPDDRFGGEAIHPDGVCGFYTPPAGEPPFAWFHEQRSPTGADSIRGRYRHPLDHGSLVGDRPDDERGAGEHVNRTDHEREDRNGHDPVGSARGAGPGKGGRDGGT